MPEIRRMRCSGRHRTLLPVPDDAIVVSTTHGDLGRGNDPILCVSADGSCYAFSAGVHASMRLVTVHGVQSYRPCSQRCLFATGLDCRCGCAGSNHGRAAR